MTEVREAALVLERVDDVEQVARASCARRACRRARARSTSMTPARPSKARRRWPWRRGRHGRALVTARRSAPQRSAADGSPAALRSMSVSSALMSASGRGGQPGT